MSLVNMCTLIAWCTVTSFYLLIWKITSSIMENIIACILKTSCPLSLFIHSKWWSNYLEKFQVGRISYVDYRVEICCSFSKAGNQAVWMKKFIADLNVVRNLIKHKTWIYMCIQLAWCAHESLLVIYNEIKFFKSDVQWENFDVKVGTDEKNF